jgi:hypothetical protein
MLLRRTRSVIRIEEAIGESRRRRHPPYIEAMVASVSGPCANEPQLNGEGPEVSPTQQRSNFSPDGGPPEPVNRPKALIGCIVAVALAATGCNGVSISRESAATSLVAAVASYDIVVARPGRFIVGLYTADQTRLLAFGTISFTFTYLGAGREAAPEPGATIGPVSAEFLPIPGQDLDLDTPGPQLVPGSHATGVYGALDVEFDRAGFWEVAIQAEVDGRTQHATGAFEVLARSDLPAVGEQAPRSRQPLAGDPAGDPSAIDSRAGHDVPIPDPELHDITIADAIAAGRPIMVVVSTPTFCVSRFCGPITDSVHELALRFGDHMEFIHLEVWQDFEANALNPAAAEWIAPTPETDAAEPWVFVIDSDGLVVQRFDNVATEADLLAAVQALIGDLADG